MKKETESEGGGEEAIRIKGPFVRNAVAGPDDDSECVLSLILSLSLERHTDLKAGRAFHMKKYQTSHEI